MVGVDRFVSDICEEERVVGGEALSKNELKVDELLLRCERGFSSVPSLFEELSDATSISAVLKEALDLRLSDRSLMKEGMKCCDECMRCSG